MVRGEVEGTWPTHVIFNSWQGWHASRDFSNSVFECKGEGMCSNSPFAGNLRVMRQNSEKLGARTLSIPGALWGQ